MKWNLKMMLPAMTTSLVVLTSFVNANYDDAQMRNLENRVSALEQRKGSNGMINPSARPYVKDGIDLSLSGDVLLWQANENGLGYVVESKQSTTSIQNGKILNPDFNWDWGFRIGLGFNMPHDGWDLFAEWTHFNTTATEHKTPPIGGALFPVWESPDSPIATDTLTEAKEHWRLRLNVIDLELGREFFVSKWLTLRPHMGLRNAWVRQNYKVEYFASDVLGAPAGISEDEIKMKNRFWGIGIRGGLDTQWGLGCGWSLYGDAAVALLRGNVRVDQQETLESTGARATLFRDRLQLTRAITDLELGIRWDQLFADDAFRLMIQVGWEHHMFFGQNQLKNFVDANFEGKFTQMNGDLAVHGWTAQVRMDF